MIPKLIGVLHLPPLPGSPLCEDKKTPAQQIAAILSDTIREAKILAQTGFEGMILENFGDVPFYKNQTPPETISAMTRIASELKKEIKIPLGINVLRNDGRSALAIAAMTGAEFIRINILSGAAATDQGIIEGEAALILRERKRLHTPVMILADALVKHAKPLSTDEMDLAVEELAGRAGADGIVVTGATTGRSVALEELQEATVAAKKFGKKIWIGSGATPEQLIRFKSLNPGIIVGSSIRKNATAGFPLDAKKCREFVHAFKNRF